MSTLHDGSRVSDTQAVERFDFTVTNVDGMSLFVREVEATSGTSRAATPVLLVHGARVPGLASFDLPVPGGSLAGDLASAGYPAYVMDVRGYGRSDRPPEMDELPAGKAPLVRVPEVARDIAAVVDAIRERRRCDRVALLGWATGGMWSGYYATLFPECLSHLILYNTLYQSPDHPSLGAGSDLEDPASPGHFNTAAIGAYRFNTAASLTPGWDRSIPVEDKTAWRDPQVLDAYIRAALTSDPTSADRMPPSFRAPSGALEDSFYQALGRQLWDASLIRTPTLVIASERDFWSQPVDRERLVQHLVHAPRVRSVVIPSATHFVHLDRPEAGRAQFLQEVLAFLADRT